jgi:signal transduction histidine kinase
MKPERDDLMRPGDQSEAAPDSQPRDFALLVAHEFRGPVHALQAYLRVLLEELPGPITDIQRDFLSSMYSISRRLERLTHDIQVTLSSGTDFAIVKDDVDVKALVEACCWELEPVAAGFGVAVDTVAIGGGSWRLHADPIRIEQIVLNLLENAIRYSAPDTVVYVRMRQSLSRIAITIENHAGSPNADDPATWFAARRRGSDSSQAYPRGLGLGLVVVDQLVRAHQGRILTRRQDHIVTFMVVFPVRLIGEHATGEDAGFAIQVGSQRISPESQARFSR